MDKTTAFRETTENVIEVRQLYVAYEDGNPVLSDVDLSVARGEFLSIVGLSGSGKSTLLHALAGFIPYEGKVVTPSDIGMVLQHYAVFPWLTVRRNVTFGLHDKPARQRNEICSHMLERVQLEEHAHKYPTQLSGGQQQRVALARALAPDPDVVFMDEPFGALDMFTRYQMHEWLSDLTAEERQTFLLVTHNIEEALFLADRLIMVGNGGLIGAFEIGYERPRRNDIKFSREFRQSVQTAIGLLEANQESPNE